VGLTGETRSANERNHLLHTPDAFVRTTLPGMTKATAVVHAAPALGAGFMQYTAEMEAGGTLGTALAGAQRFVYVLEGAVEVVEGKKSMLAAGGFAYLPTGEKHTVTAAKASRLAVIEKMFTTGATAAQVVIGKEQNVEPTALNGDEWLQVRALLPESAGMDFAVNTMEYQPGAGLSQVEVHVMEHGLLMLEGGGIYRLGEKWYSVEKGDFIWMGAYCPQWFGAIGKVPAKYLIYKDWNRHPLG